ncbi:MAG: hypothetical protein KDD73_00960 [Anaerolineales bacterium]|nr:hypothetical protein [Anaerolineales bacterium]MCB9129120.1 hypothetical protein [Ardenticatenales bacterium]
MRSLFKNVANELIQQLTPEDLKEIMDSTVVTVLGNMEPEQRLAFSQEIVTKAFTEIIESLSPEQRLEFMKTLLPTILTELPFDALTEVELIQMLTGRD